MADEFLGRARAGGRRRRVTFASAAHPCGRRWNDDCGSLRPGWLVSHCSVSARCDRHALLQPGCWSSAAATAWSSTADLAHRPSGRFDAWLVTDARSELIREIRKLSQPSRVVPEVNDYVRRGHLQIDPEPVVHTSHPTYGYRIHVDGFLAVWAPEFLEFPEWAGGADLVFAEAAGWDRPIRFVGGAGGHACALSVAHEAEVRQVGRLVFAHIGRPTLKAIDAGELAPFGEFGHDREVFTVPGPRPESRRGRTAAI